MKVFRFLFPAKKTALKSTNVSFSAEFGCFQHEKLLVKQAVRGSKIGGPGASLGEGVEIRIGGAEAPPKSI